METTDGENRPSISYHEWSKLIAEHFFNSENAGRVVYFSVDARTLSDISGLSESDATVSLVDAVRGLVTEEWRVRRVKNLTGVWETRADRTDDDEPPAIAFLAFVVLAATKMGENAKFSVSNFYKPLRQLLNPQDMDSGAPGDFTAHIEELWEAVRRWLNDELQGRRGLLPGRPASHYRYIVEALQFAVIRAAHFRKLEEFFRRIGLEPGEELPGRDLVLHLLAFLRTRHEDWARRLLSFCEDHPSIAESMVAEEARKWDGMPRDARTGRAIGRLHLGFDSIRDLSLFILAAWDDRLPEKIELPSDDGGVIEMTAIHEDKADRGWYEPIPLELNVPISEILSDGVELRSLTNSFEFQESDAYAFAFDEVAGCWTSVRSMSLEVLHHVMVQDTVVDDALRFFQTVSAIDPAVHGHYPKDWPTGWSLIRGVRLDVRPMTKVPDDLAGLLPSGAGPRLRLEGGLRVGDVQRCYLTGGEPLLILNSLEEDEPVRICRVDPVTRQPLGQVLEIDTKRHPSGEVPLWSCGMKFEEGMYSIAHGKSAITIQFVDSLTAFGGEGMSSITTRLSATFDASGTAVTPFQNEDEPLMVPAPDGTKDPKCVVVLGRDASESVRIFLPRLSQLRDLSWKDIDAWSPFQPQWCVDLTRKGRITPLCPRPLPPTSAGEVKGDWVTAVKHGDETSLATGVLQEIWHEYVRCAEDTIG